MRLTASIRFPQSFILMTLFAGPTLSACNLNKLTAGVTAGVLEAGSVSIDREADLDFAAVAFPASLKTIETFLVSDPTNEHLLLLLSRGYNGYGFAVLERELEKARITGPNELVEKLTRKAVIHYLRGREYGLRLLDHAELERAARAGDLAALDRALAELDAEDVPALFWATYGWASAVNLSQQDADMVGALPAIERMMSRVVALDSGYMLGSPLLFQGVYYASKPQMFGGDPQKSKEYFDRALQAYGDANLLVPYMYARFYATQTQDAALFAVMLERVLSADLSKTPDMRLNNEVARDLAGFWRAHADELIYQ